MDIIANASNLMAKSIWEKRLPPIVEERDRKMHSRNPEFPQNTLDRIEITCQTHPADKIPLITPPIPTITKMVNSERSGKQNKTE